MALVATTMTGIQWTGWNEHEIRDLFDNDEDFIKIDPETTQTGERTGRLYVTFYDTDADLYENNCWFITSPHLNIVSVFEDEAFREHFMMVESCEFE